MDKLISLANLARFKSYLDIAVSQISDAISKTVRFDGPQSLTEAQRMQVRRNLDLYRDDRYFILWDGVIGDHETLVTPAGTAIKVSDETPPMESMVGATLTLNAGVTIPVTAEAIQGDDTVYAILQEGFPLVIVAMEDEITIEGITIPHKGVWFADLSAAMPGAYIASLVTPSDVEGVPQKYVAGDYPSLNAGNLVSKFAQQDAEFVFRPTADHISIETGLATIKKIMGKTLVWNQLSPIPNEYVFSYDNTEGAIDVYRGISIIFSNYTTAIDGHKMLGRVRLINNGGDADACGYAYLNDNNQGNLLNAHIFEANAGPGSGQIQILLQISARKNLTVKVISQLIDLTQMFGAGNEPETVEEFEALFPAPYYPYNEGQLLSLKPTGIETNGFNQWDEEWELGRFDANGQPEADTTTIRSKNFQPCFSNTEYSATFPSIYDDLRLYWYDADKNFISESWKLRSTPFTSPNNAAYFKFRMATTYGTTYNHDICINISHSGIRDGEYEPYEKHSLPLPLTTLTGKLNGQGESVVIFPDGLRSAGTAHDEIVGNKAIKRIGARAYQQGDEDDESLITDGTTTIYELATPEEYILDTPLGLTYQVNDWGTEMLLPQGNDEDGVPATAPFNGSIDYGMNAKDMLRTLPSDYVSVKGLQGFSEAEKKVARINIGLDTAVLSAAYKATIEALAESVGKTVTWNGDIATFE